MDTICTADCDKECKYGTCYSTDKAHWYVHCEINNKDYIYGKVIDCAFKEKKG